MSQDVGLLSALSSQMSYLNHRQGVIAQNIANGDTPGYRPHDLKPMDFSSMLNVTSKTSPKLQMTATNPAHLGGASGSTTKIEEEVQKKAYETSPDGNSVVMEEQLVKSSQNMMQYNLATTLYSKNINLIKTAIDAGH